MAFDETLDERISLALKDTKTIRKRMFGGVCQFRHGNILCGVHKNNLVLRLGEEQAAKALKQEHVRVFDITGRPMKGWVEVEPPGFEGRKLKAWIKKALAFVETLPRK